MTLLKTRLKTEFGDWRNHLPSAWRGYFKEVELDFEAVDAGLQLGSHERIWPQLNGPTGAHVFKAFQDLKPEEVRVVIFGNDPYTKERQASGRSFEQRDLTNWKTDIRFRRRISPSLQSILAATTATDKRNQPYGLVNTKMAYDDYEDEGLRQPIWFSHVELARGLADGKIILPSPKKIFRYWAQQGVLWLNRTLTYTKWDSPHRESHRALWAPFTQRALEILVERGESEPIIFVMWGSSADDLEADIVAIRQVKRIPAQRIRLSKTGHPQWPQGYFRKGNPLVAINKMLDARGRIEWV